MIFLMAMSTCCQYSMFIRTDHIILAICAEKNLLYNFSIRALLTVVTCYNVSRCIAYDDTENIPRLKFLSNTLFDCAA